MDDKRTVLVACSDERRLAGICHELRADGYCAEPARCRRETQLKARSLAPSLIVLGALAQPLEQLALLREIRSGGGGFNPAVGLVALGEAGGELELARCFEAGVDDYLTRRGLRRAAGPDRRGAAPARAAPGRTEAGRGARDRPAGAPGKLRRPLELTRTEFELLNHLACDPTRVVSRRELLREVWDFQSEAQTRTVEAHAARLRRKLAEAGASGLVQTVRGLDYRLCSGQGDAAGEPPAGPRAA